MNYDFYDDMSMINGYMPINDLNNPNYNNLNNNFNSNNSLNLFNPYEGYLKGNAFKDQYIPYKNYKALKLNINNEKDELMVNIGEYSFMMHDLNLYLDTHPNDSEALKRFSEYRNTVNDLITKYKSIDKNKKLYVYSQEGELQKEYSSIGECAKYISDSFNKKYTSVYNKIWQVTKGLINSYLGYKFVYK